MLKFYNKTIKFILNNFTLAKLLGALFTAIFVASLKFYISGDFHIDYNNFWGNVSAGISGWAINTSITSWLTEYLGIKNINFNLHDFFHGFDQKMGGGGYQVDEFKPKIYNPMNMDPGDESNGSKGLDKGKGVDRGLHPNYGKNPGFRGGQLTSENKPLDQSKDIAKVTEPSDPFTGSIIPKRTNPGPGYNVPGGEVPYNDPIVQHLDYNIHFLKHFKTMDLETAIQQRNNNLLLIKITEGKLDYAKTTLSKIPPIPTTEYEFRLKNQILSDIESLNRVKIKAEARTTLITSRIEFIEGKINKN